jgi:hypothetical protein
VLSLALAGCAAELPPLAPEPPPSGPIVHLHDEDGRSASDPPLALYRIEADTTNHEYQRPLRTFGDSRFGGYSEQLVDTGRVTERFACGAPCDAQLRGPALQELYIRGEGVTPSKRFRIPPQAISVDIVVSRGKLPVHTAGTWLTAIGAVSTAAGLVTLAPAVGNSDRNLQIASGALLGLGIAGLATGLPFFLTSRTTFTVQSTLAAPAPPPAPPTPPEVPAPPPASSPDVPPLPPP